jgi:hypothetical protein
MNIFSRLFNKKKKQEPVTTGVSTLEITTEIRSDVEALKHVHNNETSVAISKAGQEIPLCVHDQNKIGHLLGNVAETLLKELNLLMELREKKLKNFKGKLPIGWENRLQFFYNINGEVLTRFIKDTCTDSIRYAIDDCNTFPRSIQFQAIWREFENFGGIIRELQELTEKSN